MRWLVYVYSSVAFNTIICHPSPLIYHCFFSPWTNETYIDRQRKRQCLPPSPSRRFLRDQPRLPRRLSRTRCHFPAHASDKVGSAPSISRINTRHHTERVSNVMVWATRHRLCGSTCRSDQGRCGERRRCRRSSTSPGRTEGWCGGSQVVQGYSID